MEAYLARQPIFDIRHRVIGYELLYRDAHAQERARILDSDKATCQLLSDAVTLFGLPRLTNAKRAFVNFTENLILNDFVRLTNPREVVVELLEDIQVTDALVEKLGELKRAGYTLALDDYTGGDEFERLLPLIDILKVDFRLTSREEQARIAAQKKVRPGLRLLAEKVETRHELERAHAMGYDLFQGYYFSRPRTVQKRFASPAKSSYGRILKELQHPNIDVERCARIVRADAVLSYRLMQKVRRLEYYRGNAIHNIPQALTMMGTNEMRRWFILVLARENSVVESEELLREAYLRGTFAEQLMRHTQYAAWSEEGFFLGMFSLMDRILGIRTETLLKEVALPSPVVQALLWREDNFYTQLLQYIMIYEMVNPALIFPDIGLDISEREVSSLYMRCLVDADRTFNLTK